MGLVEATSEKVSTFIDEVNIVDFFQNIKRKYNQLNPIVILDSDTDKFFKEDKLLNEKNNRLNEKSWTKSEKQKFYNLISKYNQGSIVIQEFNNYYELPGTFSKKKPEYLVENIDRLESILHLMEAFPYRDNQFQEDIVKKCATLLYKGDNKTLKNITYMLNEGVNKDIISNFIKPISIDSNINQKSFDSLEEYTLINNQILINDYKSRNDHILKMGGALLTSASTISLNSMTHGSNMLADYGLSGAEEYIKMGDSLDKFLNSHQSLTNNISSVGNVIIDKLHLDPLIQNTITFLQTTDIKVVVATGLILGGAYAMRSLGTGILYGLDKLSHSDKVNGFNPSSYEEAQEKMRNKVNLLSPLIQREYYELENKENYKHLLLTSFLIKKIDDPNALLQNFVKDNKSLDQVLELSKEEVKVINALNLEKISEIATIKDPYIRNIFLTNQLKEEESLVLKNLDLIEQVYGIKPSHNNNEKSQGLYFEALNRANSKGIDHSVIDDFNEATPVNKALGRAYINLFVKTDEGKKDFSMNNLLTIKEIKRDEFFKNMKNLFYREIEKFHVVNHDEMELDKKSIKDLMKDCNKDIKSSNNKEVKEAINQISKDFGLNISEEVGKLFDREDSLTAAMSKNIKNVTSNVLNNLRSRFINHSSNSNNSQTI